MGKAAKLLNHIAMALGKTIEPLVTTVTWGSSDTQYDRPASQKTGGMTNLASLYPLHVPEADKKLTRPAQTASPAVYQVLPDTRPVPGYPEQIPVAYRDRYFLRIDRAQ